MLGNLDQNKKGKGVGGDPEGPNRRGSGVGFKEQVTRDEHSFGRSVRFTQRQETIPLSLPHAINS